MNNHELPQTSDSSRWINSSLWDAKKVFDEQGRVSNLNTQHSQRMVSVALSIKNGEVRAATNTSWDTTLHFLFSDQIFPDFKKQFWLLYTVFHLATVWRTLLKFVRLNAKLCHCFFKVTINWNDRFNGRGVREKKISLNLHFLFLYL